MSGFLRFWDGDKLVCVRYKYDGKNRQRLKTIELVIERTAWEPPAEKFSTDTVVALKIEGYETELRKKARKLGGNGSQTSGFGTYDTEIFPEQVSKSIYM